MGHAGQKVNFTFYRVSHHSGVDYFFFIIAYLILLLVYPNDS